MQQALQLFHGVPEFTLQAFHLARLSGEGVGRDGQKGELFHGS